MTRTQDALEAEIASILSCVQYDMRGSVEKDLRRVFASLSAPQAAGDERPWIRLTDSIPPLSSQDEVTVRFDDGSQWTGKMRYIDFSRDGVTHYRAPVPRLSEQDVVTDKTPDTEHKDGSAYQAGRKQDAPAVEAKALENAIKKYQHEVDYLSEIKRTEFGDDALKTYSTFLAELKEIKAALQNAASQGGE